MASLVYSDSDGHVSELYLDMGINSVGRDEDNRIVIPDSSVSSCHCELIYEDDSVRVRDLGSDSGPCINGDLVDEGFLHPGDTLRVGNFEFRFQDGTPEPAYSTTASVNACSQPEEGAEFAPAGAAGLPDNQSLDPDSSPASACTNHRDVLAEWQCSQCAGRFCGTCIIDGRATGVRGVMFCPNCRSIANPLPIDGAAPVTSRSFGREMLAAWAFPFRGDGLIIMLAGGIFLAVAALVQSFVFLLAWVIAAIVSGYWTAYSQKVVTTSALGEEEPPTWPDFSDMTEDILVPLVQGIALFALYLAPYYVAASFLGEAERSSRILSYALLAGGLFMMPMAWLGVCMHSSIAALSPHFVIPSILRVPGQYFLLFLELLIVVGIQMGLEMFLEKLDIPFVGALINSFLGIYFLMVICRLLGALYHHNQDRLNWGRSR